MDQITGKYYVEDVKRRHLKNGDRLQIILESSYDRANHKKLIDFLGHDVSVSMEARDLQPELPMDEPEEDTEESEESEENEE